MNPKIDIVLQGPLDQYAVDVAYHYSSLDFVNHVIVSCWSSCPDIIKESGKIKIVRNIDPPNPGATNRNRQITSSLGGLLNVTTEFALRLRNDQRITLDSMHYMYNYYFSNNQTQMVGQNNLIGITSYYPPFPFHPRDHVWFGNTEDLIKLWSIPLDARTSLGQEDWNRISRSESYIAMWYFSLFDKDIIEMTHNPDAYLPDRSPLKHIAIAKSQFLMEKLFLTFGKINLDWPEKNIYHHFPYDINTEVWKFE